MQRRRKVAASYKKMQARPTTISEQPTSEICAVRFYWAANRPHGHHTQIAHAQPSKIVIRCCQRRATPTLAIAELTLGMLTTAWARWFYAEQNIPPGKNQPPL